MESKEVPNVDFTDRVICKTCGTEYIRNYKLRSKLEQRMKGKKKSKKYSVTCASI